MIEIPENITDEAIAILSRELTNLYPNFVELLPSVMILIGSVAVYSFLIYHFYRLVAKQDIFEVKMDKYHRAEPGMLTWIINRILSFFKYGIIFPFVVFLWFGGFSVLLFLMAKNLETAQILMISATFVAAIRLVSYYREDLSKDLAKMIPFALLGVALIDPTFFSLELFFQRIDTIILFVPQVITYATFVIFLEWILRILVSVKRLLFGTKKEIAEEVLV